MCDIRAKDIIQWQNEQISYRDGNYNGIPLSVKADVFAFGLNNASENLNIYMKVIKQLGVNMNQEKMFEDYQAIYEETVKRQERQENKRWNVGRKR